MANGNGMVRIVDGQLSFAGGIDSGRIPTISSESFPEGLKRNQLAWLTNGTCRGGGVTQRTGWKPLVQGFEWPGIFQGGYMYEPSFANPYLVVSIGGSIYLIHVDSDNSVRNLSAEFGLTNPPDEERAFFVQAEMFLVIQAGDLVTKPLFWDGVTLRRSNGLTGNVTYPNINEIPAAGPMDYYMGRLWYAFGRVYAAGDIVQNIVSGTAPYDFRDSVLKVTESPVSLSGDGFIVPAQSGNIRGLTHTAELDTALGQGRLYIGTRRDVFRCNVPVTRTDWINAGASTGRGPDNNPLQTVAQINFGFINDRSVVRVNGDLFYQAMDGIRSLALATRFFQQWGNVPISRNENRVLRFNDRALLRFASGVEFDNRLLQTVLPFQTPVGVAHQGVIPLDFDLITSLEEKYPPAWEGMLEAVYVLQLFEGDFGGLQRGFSTVVSKETGNIDIWEITTQDRFDQQVENNGNRVTWYVETPAYNWGNSFGLKQLDGLEIWIDKLLGTVEFVVDYRVDQNPCWIFYHAWKECSAKDCREDTEPVSCPEYPIQPYCESFRATMTLPKPPVRCETGNGRPTNIGYQFQFRITIKGWCRIRGLLAYALPREQAPFERMVC